MYTNASKNGTPDYYRTTHRNRFVQLYSWHYWLSLSRRWLVVGHRLMQITGAAMCLMLGLLVLFIWVYLRGRKIAVIGPFIFALFCGAAGFNLAVLQYNLHQSAYLTAPPEVRITAKIFNIDGWASDRSRLWVKIIKTDSDRPQLANAWVRVTSKTIPKAATMGR